jgi:hypothetical protein
LDLQAYLDQPGICRKPIFVFGSPRSGTHALAFALAAHSRLCTHSESEILLQLFRDDPLRGIFEDASRRVLPTWLRMYGLGKVELAGFIGLGFNALFTSRTPAGKRWIDKTPSYVLIAPLLANMFPGAQFVHMVRDGRRVVHSMSEYLARFTDEARVAVIESGHLHEWATDFRLACKTWRRHIDAGARFAAERPERVLTVVHEELVKEPARLLEQVFGFLEVPAETTPLDFLKSCRLNSSFPKNPTDLPTEENLSKPFNQWTLTGGGQFIDQSPYQESEPWWGWPPDRRATFLEEAGDAMIEHGFAGAAELEQWSRSEPAAMPANAAAALDSERYTPPQAAIERMRQAARQVIPHPSAVLVVSKHPADPFSLEGCQTFRYPRVYVPADSSQAIAHLETLRSMGAGFLLFPSTEFWWFSHFPQFRQYLKDKYRTVWQDDDCVIVNLL